MTITTFVGQNIGARKPERVKRGIFGAWAMCSVVIFAGCIVMFTKGGALIGFFTADADVVNAGGSMLRLFSYGYLALPIVQILSGALCGAGKSQVPMYFMLGCFVVLRQIYLTIAVPMTHSLLVVMAGWPATWVVCAIGMALYFFHVNWLEDAQRKLREAEE